MIKSWTGIFLSFFGWQDIKFSPVNTLHQHYNKSKYNPTIPKFNMVWSWHQKKSPVQRYFWKCDIWKVVWKIQDMETSLSINVPYFHFLLTPRGYWWIKIIIMKILFLKTYITCSLSQLVAQWAPHDLSMMSWLCLPPVSRHESMFWRQISDICYWMWDNHNTSDKIAMVVCIFGGLWNLDLQELFCWKFTTFKIK